jgi:hypothetical protein
VDYVYALVTVEAAEAKAKSTETKKAKTPEPEIIDEVSEEPEAVDEEAAAAEPEPEIGDEAVEEEQPVSDDPQAYQDEEPVAEEPVGETAELGELAGTDEDADEAVASDETEEAPYVGDEAQPAPSAVAKAAPGFSKLLDSLAGLTGFYGSQPVKVEPVVEQPETDGEESATAEEPVGEEQPAAAEEPVVEEPVEILAEEPVPVEEPVAQAVEPRAPVASEGSLQNKLTEVRAKADEARMARLRANAALYEGLGAAYDFALDAEDAPEEYLRLVEAQGLKIQLRSPMKPVVKLAFAGLCDDSTIKQLEAVLAWAFDEELPRGTLAERIEAAGGIAPILNGQAKAA